MIYIFPWPLAIVICVLMLCVTFTICVYIGSRSGLSRALAERERLHKAVTEFIAAQDVPPGNWDAIDKLRAAAAKTSR